ncbi:thaumatin-like protein [Elaeis guineensis]|uniref:thaumatin-like protein n=1 Tax=Elaeis guineensis var. tenera TaxID=51953 RepID=UPI00057A71A0
MASQTSFSLLLLLLYPFLLFTLSHAATLNIVNNCPYTVWAAAVPGGGRQLDRGQSWPINVNPGTTGGRVWARTGCSFDGNGNGHCQTGDCGGKLACTAYGGSPPSTLAEFTLNQFQNLDFIDISLVDGFNVPMDFRSTSESSSLYIQYTTDNSLVDRFNVSMDFSPTSGCSRGIRCTADIVGQCPNELKAPGGCNNPCTVFKTNEYCCNSGSCGPTFYSRFFKDRCPDAYSYPMDDQNSTFTCPGGTNYKVTFCP